MTIRKLKSGKYRLVSKKGKNLGTFATYAEAAKHEGEVEYFKRADASFDRRSKKRDASMSTVAVIERSVVDMFDFSVDTLGDSVNISASTSGITDGQCVKDSTQPIEGGHGRSLEGGVSSLFDFATDVTDFDDDPLKRRAVNWSRVALNQTRQATNDHTAIGKAQIAQNHADTSNHGEASIAHAHLATWHGEAGHTQAKAAHEHARDAHQKVHESTPKKVVERNDKPGTGFAPEVSTTAPTKKAPEAGNWRIKDRIKDAEFDLDTVIDMAKVPKRLWRGITSNRPGTYSLGKGIYSTPNKAFLKDFKYDKIIELDPKEHYPRNPLVLPTPSHLPDWLLKESGAKNMVEFNKSHDLTQFIKDRGHDGVVAGDEVVKYLLDDDQDRQSTEKIVETGHGDFDLDQPTDEAPMDRWERENGQQQPTLLADPEETVVEPPVSAEPKSEPAVTTDDHEAMVGLLHDAQEPEVTPDDSIEKPQADSLHVLNDAHELEEASTDQQKEEQATIKSLAKNVSTALTVLPESAKAGVKKHAPNIAFFADADKLSEQLAKVSPDVRAAVESGRRFHAAYLPSNGQLMITGKQDDPQSEEIATYKLAQASAGKLADSPAWRQAVSQDAQGGKLTLNAQDDPVKAWGDFGRLVWKEKVAPEALRVEYPAMTAVWEGHGLIPKDNKGPMTELTELFKAKDSIYDPPDVLADSALSPKASALATYTRIGRKSIPWLKDNVEQVGDWFKKTLSRVPQPLRMAATGLMKRMYFTYAVANQAAQTRAKARGADPHQAKFLANALTAADALLGSSQLVPIAAASTAASAGAPPLAALGVGIAAKFLPVGSLAYLVLTTGGKRSAIDTFKKASSKVRMVLAKKSKVKESSFEDDGDTQDILSNHLLSNPQDDNEMWLACFLSAMDETQGDVRLSCQIADECQGGNDGDSEFSDDLPKRPRPQYKSLPQNVVVNPSEKHKDSFHVLDTKTGGSAFVKVGPHWNSDKLADDGDEMTILRWDAAPSHLVGTPEASKYKGKGFARNTMNKLVEIAKEKNIPTLSIFGPSNDSNAVMQHYVKKGLLTPIPYSKAVHGDFHTSFKINHPQGDVRLSCQIADECQGGYDGGTDFSKGKPTPPEPRWWEEPKGKFQWDDIKDEWPDTYARDDGIGDAANHLMYDRPGHSYEGGNGDDDPNGHDFELKLVSPKNIDYARHGPNDRRVTRAMNGYKDYSIFDPSMPPPVLVERHGVYQVADGHHRSEAAHHSNIDKLWAYVAKSPHADVPYANGDKAPYHKADSIDKDSSFDLDSLTEAANGSPPFDLDSVVDFSRKHWDTPEFKKWFEGSHVKNEKGEPLVVYKGMHPFDWTKEGTPEGNDPLTIIKRTTEFPAFHRGEKGIDIAGFFGSNPEVASRFAHGAATQNGVVYPTYLSLKNPFVVDAQGKKAGHIQFGDTGKPFRDAMRSGKYDGAIIKNTDDEGDIYVAMHPHQIKSAIANKGTYDTTDPRIDFAFGDNVTFAPEPELSLMKNPTGKQLSDALRKNTRRISATGKGIVTLAGDHYAWPDDGSWNHEHVASRLGLRTGDWTGVIHGTPGDSGVKTFWSKVFQHHDPVHHPVMTKHVAFLDDWLKNTEKENADFAKGPEILVNPSGRKLKEHLLTVDPKEAYGKGIVSSNGDHYAWAFHPVSNTGLEHHEPIARRLGLKLGTWTALTHSLDNGKVRTNWLTRFPSHDKDHEPELTKHVAFLQDWLRTTEDDDNAQFSLADFAGISKVQRVINGLKPGFEAQDKGGRALKSTIKAGLEQGSHEVVERYFGEAPPEAAEKIRKKFVDSQLGYLASYVDDVHKGNVKALPSRNAMYANSLRVLQDRLLELKAKDRGAKFERRVLGTGDDNCRDCLRLARRGWVRFGTLPQIGETACKSNCKCQFEFSYSDEKPTKKNS